MNAKILVALVAIVMSFGILPAKADVALNTVSPNSGITATVTPLASEVSTTANVYIGVYVPTMDKWFLVSGGTDKWVEYKGGPLPVAQTITFGQSTTPVTVTVTYVNVFDHLYVDLTGAQVYVAYGATEQQALADGKHEQLVYTIPANPEFKYPYKVYAIGGKGGSILQLVKGVPVAVANMTPYVSGAYPLFNCIQGEKPLTDGRLPVKCQDAMTLAVHNFYTDPTNNAIYVFDGQFPSDVVWKAVQLYDPAQPDWGAKAHVPGEGWYYAPGTAAWTIHFLSDATSQDIVTYSGTFESNGTFGYMNTYSH